MQFRKEIIGENYFIDKSKRFPTYNELLIEYYEYVKENLKSTYAVKIKRSIDNFYSSLFPNIPINQLVKSDCDKAQKTISLMKVGVLTKNDYLGFLKRFFNWIKKYYDYDYRYVFLIPTFRDYSIKRQKKKAKVLELSQFIEIYKSCKSEYYRLALLTMFLFGLRISEQIGLTVDSFDFNDNTMEIYHAVSYKTQGKGYVLLTPKTSASERIIQIPESYAAMVKKHIDEHHLKKKDFIFFREPNKYNTPVHENTFRRQSEKYCQMYNADFHPHMLRASICTHLQEKGTPIEEISKYLGHEKIKVTETYYVKESQHKKEQVTEALEGIMKEII